YAATHQATGHTQQQDQRNHQHQTTKPSDNSRYAALGLPPKQSSNHHLSSLLLPITLSSKLIQRSLLLLHNNRLKLIQISRNLTNLNRQRLSVTRILCLIIATSNISQQSLQYRYTPLRDRLRNSHFKPPPQRALTSSLTIWSFSTGISRR